MTDNKAISDVQIEAFRVKAEEINRKYYEETMSIPNYFGGIEVLKGKKFVKYAITTGGSRSVYCFVEIETGNILKPASWAAPAKGKRGHIETTEPGILGSHWLYY